MCYIVKQVEAMRLCAMCHRCEAAHKTTSYCRLCHRAYCRLHYGSRRVRTRTKVLAWLNMPRTTRQLADLLGITVQHAASQVWQLRHKGLIEPIDVPQRGQPCRYQAV
jgi:hypothetical protein